MAYLSFQVIADMASGQSAGLNLVLARSEATDFHTHR